MKTTKASVRTVDHIEDSLINRDRRDQKKPPRENNKKDLDLNYLYKNLVTDRT